MPITYPYTQYGGIWKLNAASAAQGAGTWPVPPSPILQYFSTTLYTGNGSTQTITNGIDLAGQGGMVWTKVRNQPYNHYLFDSARASFGDYLRSDTVNGESAGGASYLASVSNTGYTLGATAAMNGSGNTYASWTFRESPKFFDVQTGTSSGGAVTVNHSLGVAPGLVFVKCTSGSEDWYVYHRSTGNNAFLVLNTTAAASSYSNFFAASASSFTANLGVADGKSYVVYLYAHDASSTGLIQCGSLPDTAGTVVNLGWQPQYILWKKSGSTSYWYIFDSARGMTSTVDKTLSPNSANAELTYTPPSIPFIVSPTGFTWQVSGWDGTAGADAIYMAIRDPNS